MPGFDLAKLAAEIYERDPDVEGLLLLKHGMFTFGETAERVTNATSRPSTLRSDTSRRKRECPEESAASGQRILTNRSRRFTRKARGGGTVLSSRTPTQPCD